MGEVLDNCRLASVMPHLQEDPERGSRELQASQPDLGTGED